MKTQASGIKLFLGVGAVSLAAMIAAAQTNDSPETATAAAPPSAAPSKLPYGVDDVLKLSRAQISDDVTLNYIQNSGTIYSLSAKDIVYLRNEGVSDKVINTMLDQRKTVPADAANQSALQAQATDAAAMAAAAGNPEPNSGQAGLVYAQPQPIVVQPAPVYVQPEPDPVSASTLYIIPYGPSGWSYYRYPSLYSGGSYGYPSSVYTINAGYGGGRYYGATRSGRGHAVPAHRVGRR